MNPDQPTPFDPTTGPAPDERSEASAVDPALAEIESRLLAAREGEIAEDLAAWESSAGREEGPEESRKESRFVEAVHEAWLADLRSEPSQAPASSDSQDQLSRTQTALLRKDAPSTPHGWNPIGGRTLWAAAAAALLLVAAWRLGGQDNSEVSQSPEEAPIYLGPEGSSAGTEVGDFVLLPETVDFESRVPKVGPFKIRVSNIGADPRIDEAPFDYRETVYEPRWTCPASERTQLPQLIRLEIRHGFEVPGVDPLWTAFYRTR